MDRRTLDLVSSDFQRIVAAEVAPKMDLIVETKIACPIASEVFRSTTPRLPETIDTGLFVVPRVMK